jgi:hypothetical protein
VNIANWGASFAAGVTYTYIDRWSDTAAWAGGLVPADNESVVIPSTALIILDVSSAALETLVIRGTLLWDDTGELELRAANIIIDGGKLVVCDLPSCTEHCSACQGSQGTACPSC